MFSSTKQMLMLQLPTTLLIYMDSVICIAICKVDTRSSGEIVNAKIPSLPITGALLSTIRCFADLSLRPFSMSESSIVRPFCSVFEMAGSGGPPEGGGGGPGGGGGGGGGIVVTETLETTIYKNLSVKHQHTKELTSVFSVLLSKEKE